MPQVCNLLVYHARDSPGLERFVMDKCAESMHIALQVFFFLQAAVEDKARQPDKVAEARVRLLRTRCETPAVNGSKHAMLQAAATRASAATLVATESPFSARKRQVDGNSLLPSSSAREISVKDNGKSPKRTPGRRSISAARAVQVSSFGKLAQDKKEGALLEAVTHTLGELMRTVSGTDKAELEPIDEMREENGRDGNADEGNVDQSTQHSTHIVADAASPTPDQILALVSGQGIG